MSIIDKFENVPLTLAEVEADRVGKPILKGTSRLERTEAEKPLTIVDEKAFRKAVIDRDGYICRRCSRKVVKTLARVSERLEVHHVHGRRGDLQFEDKAALVLCLACHEKVTGRVNERWIIVPTQMFVLHEWAYTDATFPVSFERVA